MLITELNENMVQNVVLLHKDCMFVFIVHLVNVVLIPFSLFSEVFTEPYAT